ncbi:MAG TPA: asparagine synthase (glutamine-hydrolyzing) [Thermoanaerobaculia bacterium]
MCGIVGVVSEAVQLDLQSFDRMVDALSSRGPDGRGTRSLAEGRVLLGHRRLAIIDPTSAGAQPISNESGTIWLTFNGEIYNYKTLRQILVETGHVFRSHSDSEVVVHAYEEWGADCVKRFNGIFAFGIWDGPNEQLFLARDHLGVKPLYYAQFHSRFAFASQPKAILEDPGFTRAVDPDGLADFFSFGYVSGERSAYEGMKKLPAGHTALLRRGHLSLSRYWSLEYRPTLHDPREVQLQLRDSLLSAIESQLVSDVPVGCFLSGGIDSSLIVAIASRRLANFRTFTVGFDEPASDERHYAEVVARKFSTQHVTRTAERRHLERELWKLQDSFDEPFDPNGPLPFMHVASLAQSNATKVVLGGDGADELFAGYLRYDDFDRPEWLRGMAARLYHGMRKNGILGPRALKPHDAERYFRYEGCLPRDMQRDLFTAAFYSRLDESAASAIGMRAETGAPAITAAQLTDMHHYLVDHVLCKVDRASMAYGVETRVPFLDVRLVELAFRIPLSINYRRGERKALLKTVARQFLPDEVVTSRKKGFSSPLHRWADEEFRRWAHNQVTGGCLVQMSILRPDWSEAFLRLKKKSPAIAARLEWLLLTAELWARRWLDQREMTS